MNDICLWLDDERPMPEGYTHHAKTAQEAIALLETGNVIIMSLDHDLGDGPTGYEVAKYIEENAINDKLNPIHFRVHSQNAVGKQNIKLALQNALKAWNAKRFQKD